MSGLPRHAAAATGVAAEQQAARWLQARGLRLMERNWRCRQGELDLVMQDGATLVIVEVRARRHGSFGGAAGSVDVRKCRRVVAATQAWLLANPHWNTAPLRFDVLAYEADGRCDWLQAAFTTDDLA